MITIPTGKPEITAINVITPIPTKIPVIICPLVGSEDEVLGFEDDVG